MPAKRETPDLPKALIETLYLAVLGASVLRLEVPIIALLQLLLSPIPANVHFRVFTGRLHVIILWPTKGFHCSEPDAFPACLNPTSRITSVSIYQISIIALLFLLNTLPAISTNTLPCLTDRSLTLYVETIKKGLNKAVTITSITRKKIPIITTFIRDRLKCSVTTERN
jgi:hypothetical protein